MSAATNWQLLLDCAKKLTAAGRTPFTRQQLIQCVQKADPSRGDSSLHPTIQGMTDNAQGGPLSACGEVFHRVGRGLYVLKEDWDGGREDTPAKTLQDAPSGDAIEVTDEAGRTVAYLTGVDEVPRRGGSGTTAQPSVSGGEAAGSSPSEDRPQAAPRGDDSHTRRIGLVGCVKDKEPGPAPARLLYRSALFRGRWSYVERSCSSWFILSAKYGLVHPDRLLEWYDRTLKKASSGERRAWSREVLTELARVLGDLEGVVFEIHAGAEYRNYGLTSGLQERGALVDVPAAGLSFGRQLHFYAIANDEPGPHERQTCSDAEVMGALEALDGQPTKVRACDWPGALTGLEMAGLYSWWVDESGAGNLAEGLALPLAPGRIYAGQAGAIRWPSGTVSATTLGSRIGGNHLRGSVEGSTFRLTLASILSGNLALERIAPERLSSSSEARLTQWMRAHLSVAVHPVPNRSVLGHLEAQVVARLDPPLNLDHCEPSPIRGRLSALRHLMG